jgi:hypothetical protein
MINDRQDELTRRVLNLPPDLANRIAREVILRMARAARELRIRTREHMQGRVLPIVRMLNRDSTGYHIPRTRDGTQNRLVDNHWLGLLGGPVAAPYMRISENGPQLNYYPTEAELRELWAITPRSPWRRP